MSIELQPPVLSVSPVKTEPPTVIKNEPPESEIVETGNNDILDSSESEEEIIQDVKDIDIVYHPVCEDAIKSEILERYHSESVETQILLKAENSLFIKTKNVTQRNKTKDINDGHVTRGTGQGVVEVQGSIKHSNTVSNLETDKQCVLNSSKDLNCFNTKSRKAKQPENSYVAKCYKTIDTTSWKKDKEKIKVIRAPMIPIEPHEYTSLAQDKHVCNHCQHACNKLYNLKLHINKMHREVTTMYQCPYCPYKSKGSLYNHIIQKHRDSKDIQWFQCHLCEKKFKIKYSLVKHMNVHLTLDQMQDRLEICSICGQRFKEGNNLRQHIRFVHSKEKRHRERKKCQEWEYTTTESQLLEYYTKSTYGKRFGCNKCDYKTYRSTNLNMHKLKHLKPEEIQYFHCYHCSYKCARKSQLKTHIFRRHETYRLDAFKVHKIIHLKPEEIQYFYCYHCSFKSKRKGNLKSHIFRHFKNQEIKFHCYICNFMTITRDLITEHIKKHSKVQIVE